MDEKRNAVFTISVICVILLAFCVADLIKPDKVFSETENRVLASRPEFSKEALLQGTYTEDYETYTTDQFVGRDKWILLKTSTDILLQKKDIRGVYLGEDDYLIEQHRPENYTAELEEKRLRQLEKLVDKWDAQVMLVPTADNILTDKLPDYATYYDQKAFLDKVKEQVGDDHYIDVYSVLDEHSEEEIYYRTDHHWTSLGAFYGYDKWREKMGYARLIREVDRRETVTEDFLGTLHSKLNLPMEGDAIQYFTDTNRHPVKVTYDFTKTTDSYYEAKHLNTKNKYAYFLDDNHGLVEIKTQRPNGRTLFVIKDSYANCTIPLLAQHYENVYVVDLRYFNAKLFPFMEQYGQPGEMDVLVLYNCIHFLEDFKYFE